jgi:hypothetical protein
MFPRHHRRGENVVGELENLEAEPMNYAFVRYNFQNFGAVACVHDVAKRAVNKVVPFRVLRTMKLTREGVDARYLEMPSGFRGHFATADELARWQGEARHQLDRKFLQEALAREDRCFAITSGQSLASYGWYAQRPTAISTDLVLHFNPAWVYMFKGYTLPEFRGMRLHAIGMAHALDAHVREGAKGLLSYVESNNFASLRSCYRMGYEPLGTIVACRLHRKTHTFESPACRRYGLRLETAAPSPRHTTAGDGAERASPQTIIRPRLGWP